MGRKESNQTNKQNMDPSLWWKTVSSQEAWWSGFTLFPKELKFPHHSALLLGLKYGILGTFRVTVMDFINI